MSKSIKLEEDVYLESNSVNYKRNNLEQFLVNRFTINSIKIGNLADFNQQYGYKQVNIEVPANSMMIVCGLHTNGVGASCGLQITNIYNGLYKNDTDKAVNIICYLNYHCDTTITDTSYDTYLQVLFVKVK